ncbi:MAG: hypothetical protein EXS36_01505 [Pedosphaera sp.]|nr:hypothetical protein [Pedosphaera sp.]
MILNSYGHRVVGDHLTGFEPGDLVFIVPNLPHFWHHEGLHRKDGESHYSIVVRFLEDFLGRDFLMRPELTPVRQLISRGAVALQVMYFCNSSLCSSLIRFCRPSTANTTWR